MKGADQCPRCASRRWMDVNQDELEAEAPFYGRIIRACANCKTLWEPFDPAETIDPGRPNESFREPCDNCAFRPGSVEQADVEEWKKTMASLKKGAAFHCHKGVPIDPKNENGFAYPKDGRDPRKLRLCRGYLNMLGTRLGWKEPA